MKITFKARNGKIQLEITCESEAGGGQNSLTLALKPKISQSSSNQKTPDNSKGEKTLGEVTELEVELASKIIIHKGHLIIQNADGDFLVPSLSPNPKSLQEAFAAIDQEVSTLEVSKGFRSRNLVNGEIPSI